MKTTKKINATAIIAVLVFSAFIATFNETVLNVALSVIMKEMNVTPGTAKWLITAYMIIPIVMNTALLVAPKEKIGSLMAICVCAVTLGPAFGPTVSGIVLQYFS